MKESELLAMAKAIPPEIMQQVHRAVQSGRCLCCFWRIVGQEVVMDRTTIDYPISEIDKSLELLTKDARRIKAAP